MALMMAERIFYQHGMMRAARIADREADKIMKAAERYHRKGLYDLYESMETTATVASGIAAEIRKAASKKNIPNELPEYKVSN